MQKYCNFKSFFSLYDKTFIILYNLSLMVITEKFLIAFGLDFSINLRLTSQIELIEIRLNSK